MPALPRGGPAAAASQEDGPAARCSHRSAPSLLRHHPAGPRRRSPRYWRGRAALFVSSSASAPWARGGGWDAQGLGSAGDPGGERRRGLRARASSAWSEARLRVGGAGRRGAVGALRVNFPLQDGPEAAGWRAELGPAMGSPGLSSLPVPAGSVVRLSFPFAVVGGRQGSLVQPSFLLREPAGAAGPPVACASGATSGRRGAGQPGLCRVPPAARSLTVSLVFCLK